MNKLILILAIILVGCSTECKKDVIGVEYFPDGSKTDLISGDIQHTKIFEDFIELHNAKDFNGIRNLVDEEIKIYAATGDSLIGKEAHLTFLKSWLNDSSPEWKAHYLIANDYINKDGIIEHWVTSCYEMSTQEDGQKNTFTHIYDAKIELGKIQKFYIYERNK
tara:strand:- start:1632 stop:2123 length:492 start_codon:yes stop_codon:yes gene_type:complete